MDPTQSPIQEPVQTPVQIPDFQSKPNYLKTIIFSVLIVITLGLIAYLIFLNQKLQKQILNPPVSPTIQVPSPTSKPSSSISIPPDETTNWKVYEDKKWGFSVKYPGGFFTACYPDEGLKLWGPNFDCKGPHDIFYTISVIGYDDKDYKPYKTPAKTEKIVVAKKNASKNTYLFDESDGPLFGLHEETEIVIPLQSGLIQLVLLGQDEKNKVFFNQILSTFKFIDDKSVCVPTYRVETNSTELTAKQNYSVRCTEQRSEKDCLSIDLYNRKADDFSIPDKIPDCIWKNPINTD